MDLLIRALAEIVGQVLVPGLGYLILRAIAPRREFSDDTCLYIGALAWLILGLGSAWLWLRFT